MRDVVIIGAGVTGCSVAGALAPYELDVLVLDKAGDLCAGASRGNSAMVHAGYDPEPGSNKAVFNVLGNAMFDTLCQELDVPFQRSGTYVIALTESEMQEIRRLKEQGDRNSVPGVAVLEQPQLRARLPDIGREVLGALYAPTGGIVCPYTLVIAMAEHAARNSVLFEFDTTVTGFRREDGAWIVQTNRGEIRTRTIFNCAGTYADQLNNMVSADTFTIQPRFGSHILLDKEYITHVGTTICQTPVKLPTGGHTKGMGVMPSADRTVILGCDSEDVADRDDTACTARSLARIVDYFEKSWTHFPIGRSANHFPFEGIINAYGGLRAHSDRNDFIIGEVSDAPGFFNAAGIESPGLTAGPAIGRHLADLAVNRLQPEKKKDFLPGRQVLRPFRQMSTEERREAIRENPDYGKIVCRCEWVTEAEVRDAIRRPLGARNVNAVKMRTRAGMGRCQGGFCGPRVLQILCEELSLNPLQVTLSGGNSYVLAAQSCQTAYQEPTDAPG